MNKKIIRNIIVGVGISGLVLGFSVWAEKVEEAERKESTKSEVTTQVKQAEERLNKKVSEDIVTYFKEHKSELKGDKGEEGKNGASRKSGVNGKNGQNGCTYIGPYIGWVCP